MPWRSWLRTKWPEAPLKLIGSVMIFDGDEMNESPMSAGANVGGIGGLVNVEREVGTMRTSH